MKKKPETKMPQVPVNEKLYEFYSGIYPRRLWVYFGNDAEFIAKTFNPHEELTEKAQLDGMRNILEGDSFGATVQVYEQSTKFYGVLLVFPNIAEQTVVERLKSFAHESVHACDMIFQELGIEKQDFDDGNEAYAYLLEWVFGNIFESYLAYKETYENNRQ